MEAPDRERVADTDGNPRGRVESIQDWLLRRADTAVGRLALQWFRSYFAASRNSGCAATIYSSLSVLPAALVAVAYFHPLQGDANVFAQRLVTHMKLTGTTATLVEGTFGTASSNALAATVTVVISFLIWGIGIGQIYQDVYARAWGIKVGSLADQGLFALFFFLLSGAIAVALVGAARLRGAGLLVLLPAWLVASTAFWLLVPRMLLHRRVRLRALVPGALLASVVLGGAMATSPLFLAAPLNQNGKAFGSFGVVLTMIGYVFIMITLSLVCAVFSPVWAHWRNTEKRHRARSTFTERQLPE
jgi:membrane protein